MPHAIQFVWQNISLDINGRKFSPLSFVKGYNYSKSAPFYSFRPKTKGCTFLFSFLLISWWLLFCWYNLFIGYVLFIYFFFFCFRWKAVQMHALHVRHVQEALPRETHGAARRAFKCRLSFPFLLFIWRVSIYCYQLRTNLRTNC